MPVITMPARKCGKSFSHAEQIEIGLLNALFDAGHPLTVTDLETKLRCHRRDLLRAITAQYRHGNIRKGQPVELTTSGHIAVAAGRYAGAMAVAA